MVEKYRLTLMRVCVYENYYKEASLSGRWCFFSLAARSTHIDVGVGDYFLFSLRSRLIKKTASEGVCVCV